MKKILLAIGIILLLAACGSDEEEDVAAIETEQPAEEQEDYNDELGDFAMTDEAIQERDKFIETYNSYEETENIKDIQEPRKESQAVWQLLYDGDATIEIKYDEEGNVYGYHVAFNPEAENGLLYASIVAESLGLELDTFLDKVDKSVNGEEADYSENDYDITFTNMLELEFFAVNFHK